MLGIDTPHKLVVLCDACWVLNQESMDNCMHVCPTDNIYTPSPYIQQYIGIKALLTSLHSVVCNPNQSLQK